MLITRVAGGRRIVLCWRGVELLVLGGRIALWRRGVELLVLGGRRCLDGCGRRRRGVNRCGHGGGGRRLLWGSASALLCGD